MLENCTKNFLSEIFDTDKINDLLSLSCELFSIHLDKKIEPRHGADVQKTFIECAKINLNFLQLS